MCDFLISLNSRYNGKCLLELIKVPYGKRSPHGKSYELQWGSLAVLEERIAKGRNILEKADTIFAWVGDLLIDPSTGGLDQIVTRISDIWEHSTLSDASLQNDPVLAKLNGTYAIVLAGSKGLTIVTDPVNLTPVYAGRNEQGQVVALGTHPDLVACITGNSIDVDTVSVVEFLYGGCCTFPNTAHNNVKQMEPGRLHCFKFDGGRLSTASYVYWLPPEPIQGDCDERKLAQELRSSLLSAVRDRCTGAKLGVTLSGGQDSRFVIAAVPHTVECIAITYCDQINREARIAQRVAKSHNSRPWYVFTRDSEFLGRTVVDIVKLVGCEFDWVNAHSFGFVDRIAELGVDNVLSGWLFDTYFKALFAYDYVRESRMKGLLPAMYKKRAFDYCQYTNLWESNPSFWRATLLDGFVAGISERRKAFYQKAMSSGRRNVEYLVMYPFSHLMDGATWVAERRVLPVRIIAADRRVWDFAFRCPVEFKLGKKIFEEAALPVYGPSANIPFADSGLKPGSGHLSRLFQRCIREMSDRAASVLKRLGKRHIVEHSWSDYDEYWGRSVMLRGLVAEYGSQLDPFDGIIFKGHGRDLFGCEDIGWRNGFRILQFAIWLKIVDDYRRYLKQNRQ